jgi:hypothetical protein
MFTSLARAAALTAALALPATAHAQTTVVALPTGSVAEASLGANGAPARFRVSVPSAGVLTVAAHGKSDLVLRVTDDEGQALPDGTSDRDLGGDLGAEVLAVVLPEGGNYLVSVSSNDETSRARFTISSTFLAMPSFAKPADPDRRPSQARALTVGTAHSDQLHPAANDLWDWYVISATDAMTLVVATRTEEESEGDLVLEGYIGGKFQDPVVQSDNDLQGQLGNESVTVNLRPGDTLHIKVRSLSEGSGPIPYRLSVGRMP